MSHQILKVRSSVKPALMRYTLFRGTFVGAIGAALMLYSATSLSITTLESWGLLIISLSVLLIALGMIPIRKLSRLEQKPDEIVLDDKMLHYISQRKQSFTIPLEKIEKMIYYERGRQYGIEFWIKDGEANRRIRIPYFSQHAVDTLQQDESDKE